MCIRVRLSPCWRDSADGATATASVPGTGGGGVTGFEGAAGVPASPPHAARTAMPANATSERGAAHTPRRNGATDERDMLPNVCGSVARGHHPNE